MTNIYEVYILVLLSIPCFGFQHLNDPQHIVQRYHQQQKFHAPAVQIKDFVSLENVNSKPKLYQHVTAKYQCSKPLIILVFVDGYHYDFKQDVDTSHDPEVFFRTAWNCSRSPIVMAHNITIVYPKTMVLGPSPLLPKVWNIRNATLKVAMVDQIAWDYAAELKHLNRDVFHILYEKPNKESNKCYSWEFDLLDDMLKKHMPQSYHDDAVMTLASYPLALEGSVEGTITKFSPFFNPELRAPKLTDPNFVFTVSMFVTKYCDSPICGILTKVNAEDEYDTPSIFIKQEGKLLVQLALMDEKRYAYISSFVIPLRQWVQLVWEQKGTVTNITMRYGQNFTESNNFVSQFHIQPRVDYPDGYLTLGGNTFVNAFTGFIGDAKLIRSSTLTADKIPVPSQDSAMYTLGIEEYVIESEKLKQTLLNKRHQMLEHASSEFKKDVCRQPFEYMMSLYGGMEVCAVEPSVLPKKYRKLGNIIGTKLSRRLTDDKYIEQFAERAFQKALVSLENVKKPMKLINLLDLSAKLGNRHANYFLYAIYINGIFVDINEEKARLYLTMGAYNGCRLSTKALGNNFLTGKDGFPIDIAMSFFYYFKAAHFSQWDKRTHSEKMTAVNNVRLSDEKEMKKQLNEDEDSFQWMKFQASKGLLDAKRNLASMLFWGKQGLKRDLTQAFEYYKEAAVDSNDPVAVYDYGISLIKGYGTEVDIEGGIAVMEKAADLNSVSALNTLGWYYTQQKVDYKKAIEYFERAADLGQMDAIYNLGFMWHKGHYPDEKRNFKKAFDYYFKAAKLGHAEASYFTSLWFATGIKDHVQSNVYYAILWARYLSEISPDMGEFIREALQAYRGDSYAKAAVLYIVAAETGFEVAGFNAAFMLEEHKEVKDMIKLKKDCEWRFWNASTTNVNMPHPYALNKMGDNYYYGTNDERDTNKSMVWYARASMAGNAQSMFNLALILEEENVTVNEEVVKILSIPSNNTNMSDIDVILHLYRTCISMHTDETQVPCYMGLIRVQSIAMWNETGIHIKMLVALLVGLLTVGVVYLTRCFKQSDEIVTMEQGTTEETQHTRLLQDTTIENEVTHNGDILHNHESETEHFNVDRNSNHTTDEL